MLMMMMTKKEKKEEIGRRYIYAVSRADAEKVDAMKEMEKGSGTQKREDLYSSLARQEMESLA
tara:strand:+ start:633 stop:821 length:189 start_codon:yes stop_codon:yes gene_type:complete